jgi:hypothetical protein
MTLGKYPDVPLSLARDGQGDARKLLVTGIDPMAQRKADEIAEDDRPWFPWIGVYHLARAWLPA